MSIATWNDLYYHLWTQAAQSRGTVTSLTGAASAERYNTIAEWPRTTGADAIAIASLVDPALGALPLRPGGYGITRLWQTAVIELEELAFGQPAAEYRDNPSFWSTLLPVASYLDTMGAPLPPEEAWEALLSALWAPIEFRNASAPTTRTITESTVEKMWDTQHDEMVKARGFDLREPTGAMLGRAMKVPRTTNADIVRLANYWAERLSDFVTKVITGHVSNSMGLEGQSQRWAVILDDVDGLARKGKPDEVYPKNHEFWRETLSLAINLAVWHEVPTPFELAIGATKQAVIDLPGRLSDAVGGVAHALGTIAHEAGAGLLSGLGKPLLIGGGLLVGLVLLLRGGRSHERGQEAA